MVIITDIKDFSHHLYMDKTGAAAFIGVSVKTLYRVLEKGGFFKQYFISEQDPIKSRRGKK